MHLVLGRVALAAGQRNEADEHADAARFLAASDPARVARAYAVAAQAAMGRDDVNSALPAAAKALGAARATNQPEVHCEALEVIGRVQRGRDVPAAEAAFVDALDVATEAALPVWRVRALQELGTIDMFESLATERLLEARRIAVELGALSTLAVIDLQLAAIHDERGELDLALAAARRCEESSRQWGLATLPMSLAIQSMAHARAGRRQEMEAAAAAAIATGQDQESVEIGVSGNGRAIYHLGSGDLAAAALELGPWGISRRSWPCPGAHADPMRRDRCSSPPR